MKHSKFGARMGVNTGSREPGWSGVYGIVQGRRGANLGKCDGEGYRACLKNWRVIIKDPVSRHLALFLFLRPLQAESRASAPPRGAEPRPEAVKPWVPATGLSGDSCHTEIRKRLWHKKWQYLRSGRKQHVNFTKGIKTSSAMVQINQEVSRRRF